MAHDMTPQWITDIIAVAPWLGAFCFAGFIIWKVGPVLRKWGRFLDRINGVPEDKKSGQKEIPGLFERMDRQDELLETIRHELFPNSGKSLRDAVDKQHKQLEDHLAQCPPPTTTINVNPPGGTP
ncbi:MULTISPECIES: hypothetical protein [Paenarthrobacter]|uniref:Uncharacterized protein n=1 Tax=Paenarthrobacter ureafaciens TaxID=37931 RepID=A0AAX3EFL6_PAEUR|nr:MULTISPECIES: hypothetical protein [Paenarthrobacter]MDO5866042.1 hypothetical protein [Paenarthrobacter sp. SD-2]MDO5877139.1 hypothetical protein [Paenarthrobacter sp. SD-1]UYV92340.1 hypothetical protein NL395_17735 [Paenarthrobacter ureafaciens]UYV96875.1 hypothetical protein NL394_17765 [Paenarthrobacter ureafaciens]